MDDSIIGDIADAVGDELKKFGISAASQVTGRPQDQTTPTAGDLKTMTKSDKEFSKKGEAEVRVRIARIYAEYARKQKQGEMIKERQETQQEVQHGEISKEQKKQAMDVAVAQTKASAEIKNYGAE